MYLYDLPDGSYGRPLGELTLSEDERETVARWSRRSRPLPWRRWSARRRTRPTDRGHRCPPARPVGIDGQPDLEGVQPQAHQVDTFKLSTDPQFIDKVRDVVGLYLDPPESPTELAAHPGSICTTPHILCWLNHVERWFGLLTDQQLRRAVHKTVQALEKDIRTWTKTADQIWNA